MYDNEEVKKLHAPRAQFISHAIVAAFSLVLARLWYLQVYKGELLLTYSLQNSLRREVVMAPRGMMFDRTEQLIVNNVPRFDAAVTPQYLKDRPKTVKKLAEVLNMQEIEIYMILKKRSNMARYKPIVVKKDISRQEVARIETENEELPGVSVETFISREYVDREIGAHLLGYISEISQKQLPDYRNRDQYDYKLGDMIGQSGLEQELDPIVRGADGFEYVEVDALGRKKRHRSSDDNFFRNIKNVPAVPGLNVQLTIDRDMQLEAARVLKDKEGAAVAVDIHTGEILTMVSTPAFDPSYFGKGGTGDYITSLFADPKRPFRDRAIQEHYSPGSTFKTFAMIAGLEEGLIDRHTDVNCTKQFRLGRRIFHCWKLHGTVDTTRALRESCDTYFYKLATRMDIDVLSHYAKLFGMGSKTFIDLPRETTGLIPSREWKKKKLGQEWVMGETLSCIIGQSYVLTTPLQLTMAYAAIANGGKLYRPYVVKRIFSNAGKIYKQTKPHLVRHLNVSQETLSIVRNALFQVGNHPNGTAYWFRPKGVMMAGKTGTSQVIGMTKEQLFGKCEEHEYKFRHHGLFVGYAPAENPRIAVATIIEHGCHGSSAGAPVAGAIMATYMKKYYPKLYQKYVDEDKQIIASTLATGDKRLIGSSSRSENDGEAEVLNSAVATGSTKSDTSVDTPAVGD